MGKKSGKTNVLFLTDNLGGGTGRVMLDLLRGFDRSRFNLHLGTVSSRGEWFDDLPPDVTRHLLTSSQVGWRIDRLLLMGRLIRLVRSERIEIVLSALETSNIYAAVLKKMLPRVTVVLGYHTNLSAFNRISQDPYHFFGLPMRWYIRHLYSWADAIVAPSQGAAGDLAATYGLPSHKIHAIPNPVDLASIRKLGSESADLPWSRNGAPILSCAGTHRWIDTKGFDLLVEALALLKGKRAPRLMVIGSGPQEDRVRKLASDRRLGNRVWFAGRQKNPWKWMAASDLFVLPSRFETFSLVLVEAMALGVPVLASDCAFGPGEIVEHGRNGWLVPPEKEKALAEAIDRLIKDPPLLKRLARHGKDRAEDFSPSRVIPKYEDLMLTLAHTASGAGRALRAS